MAIFRRGPATEASNARVIWKNHAFQPIYRFILQMMQDTAITMEGAMKPHRSKLSNGTIVWMTWADHYSTSNNLKMVQHTSILTMADQIAIKSRMIYRTAPFSMTLNDPYRPTPSLKVTPFFDAEYLRNGTT